MAFVMRSDKEIEALGQSLVITRAMEMLGGGGAHEAAQALGLSNAQSVKDWMLGKRRIPTKYLNRIRDLTRGKVKPQALLDEMDNFDYSE